MWLIPGKEEYKINKSNDQKKHFLSFFVLPFLSFFSSLFLLGEPIKMILMNSYNEDGKSIKISPRKNIQIFIWEITSTQHIHTVVMLYSSI